MCQPCTFLWQNSLQNRISFNSDSICKPRRFKLQSSCNRIQNDAQSDSKLWTRKLQSSFDLDFFHYTLQNIFELTFFLYIYTLFNNLRLTTLIKEVYSIYFLKTMCEQFKFRYLYQNIFNSALYIFSTSTYKL